MNIFCEEIEMLRVRSHFQRVIAHMLNEMIHFILLVHSVSIFFKVRISVGL